MVYTLQVPMAQWPEDPAQIMILDEDVPLAPLPKTGEGPRSFYDNRGDKAQGISRHETKIRGIRCNKQTDLELIYEIPDFPVRGNGPSDDFYIVGFGLLSGRPVLDDFIDGAKDGMKTVAGILPTLVGLLVSVGVPQGIRFSGFSGRAAADACGPSAHTSPNCACGPGASGIQLSSHRAGAGHI